MANYFKNYEVFISSPSDVASERDAVEDAIEQINQIRGSKDHFRLSSIRWERDVASQIGSHPQNVINEQVGDDYDIFVGILCNQFGHKTEYYNSGTEEEFFRAYERLKSKGNSPEILFYFKDPRKSLSHIDAEQLLKVQEFKKKISSLGVYGEFDTTENLKTMVMAALVKAIDRLSVTTDSQDVPDHLLNAVSDNMLVPLSDFDEDVGLMELTEMFHDAMENFTDTFDTITAATGSLSERITTRTDELKSFVSINDSRQDQKAVKEIIEKVAKEMQRYSHILDQSTPAATRDFASVLRCMQHAVIISHEDGISSGDDVKEIVEGLVALQATLSTVHEQVSSFKDAISLTPRMTSKLNQAKRRTLKSISDLLDFISEGSVNVGTTLISIG